MEQKLIDAIVSMKEEEAISTAKAMIDNGTSPDAVLDACRQAMEIVGKRYEAKEFFLPELIISGEIFKAIGEMVKPLMKSEEGDTTPRGTIVIGTVAGDIHDIGKDIVAFMLDINNFEVHDLGVDVPAQVFVDKIKEVQPQVVALSGFLTLAFDQMKATVEAIQQANLRDGVKIMVGGAPMDDAATRYIGADAFGSDAGAAVSLAKTWIGES